MNTFDRLLVNIFAVFTAGWFGMWRHSLDAGMAAWCMLFTLYALTEAICSAIKARK